MRQFKKRMLANGLALSLILSSLPTTYVSATENKNIKFSDVKGHWAESFINYFTNKGYINGYGDGTFRPNNKVTRAEFVKIVNMTFGFTQKGNENFSDVNKDDWYYDEVLKAVKQGYINGYEDGTFKPNNEITREEACKIIGFILEVSGDGKTKFKDEKEISDWAIKYVDGLVDKGIIHGYEDNTFKPKDNATRAESVKTLYGAKDKYNPGEEVPPVINPIPPLEPPVDSDPTIDYNDLLNPENPKWNLDTDNDGIWDAEEEILGSDPLSKDGDNDGLLDSFEVKELLSDAKNKDTDNNEILDADEDNDLDGLTNLEEQNLNTDPLSKDTDIDGLTDEEEVNIYKTNPLEDDSDGDGLLDGIEIELGINPNKKDSDNNGINDNEEYYNTSIKCGEFSKDEELEIAIVGDIKAKYINEIKMTNMENDHDYINSEIQGYIGAPYEIFMGYNIPLEDVKVQFKIYSGTIKNKNITNPTIYGYNEGSHKLEKMNSTFNVGDNGDVYVEVKPLSKYSTYVVLDNSKIKTLDSDKVVPLDMVNGGKVSVDHGLLLKTADASYTDLTGKINKTTLGMIDILKDKTIPRDDLDSLKIVSSDNPNDGFGGTAFLVGNRLIVSYAGTELTSIKDIAADLALGLIGQTSQVKEAADFMYYTVNSLQKIYKIDVKNVYITGHSLGGYLAQNIFYRCKDGQIKIDIDKENIRGAIFNSAPIFFPNSVKYYDAKDIIDNKGEWEKNGFGSDKYNKLKSYHICGDFLLDITKQTKGILGNSGLSGRLITSNKKIYNYSDLCSNGSDKHTIGFAEHGIKNFYKHSIITDDEAQIADSTIKGDWNLGGSSYINERNELVLTEAEYNKVGTAWYNAKVSLPFEVEFEYLAGGGEGSEGGADGFVFMFNKDKEYEPADGHHMGFSDGGYSIGYGIEFDSSGTEWNPHDPVFGEHIAVIENSAESHLVHTEEGKVPQAEDGLWHKAKINISKNSIDVFIDNENVLSYTHTEDFNDEFDNIGFSAGTASGNNWHKIRNFKISGDNIENRKSILFGNIKSSNGFDVKDVEVIVKDINNDSIIASSTTDKLGRYIINGLDQKEYKVELKLHGRVLKSTTVDLKNGYNEKNMLLVPLRD